MEKKQLDLHINEVSLIRSFLILIVITLGLFLLIRLTIIIIILFISFILTSGLRPLVLQLKKRKIPQWLTILLIYLGLASLFALVISLVFIPLLNELNNFFLDIQSETFVNNLQNYLNKDTGSAYTNNLVLLLRDSVNETLSSAVISWGQISSGLGGLVNSAKQIYLVIFYLISALLFTWYMLAEHEVIIQAILYPIKNKVQRQQIRDLITKLEYSMGKWLQGELVLMFLVGLITYLILSVLHVKYALPLALLAGLLELIPNLGPFIATIITVPLVILSNGVITGLSVLVFYILVQVTENYYLVPKIMHVAVGLNPFIILLGVYAGNALFGILGSLLAVPVMVTLQIVVNYLREESDTLPVNN